MMGLFQYCRNKIRPAARINEKIPVEKVRYVAIDTELTGLDERKDSIVSVGAVRMVGGRIDIGSSFYRLVRPDSELTAASIVIHEITPSEVMEKPDISEVLEEFIGLCGNDVIVGYCLSIDMSFINREMKRIFCRPLTNEMLDVRLLWDWLSKRHTNHKAFSMPLREQSLYEMGKRLDIMLSGAHNAVMDAFITAQVFQRLIPLLLESGIRRIGDLLNIGSPERGGGRFKLGGEASNF
ncbi:MAG: 3'-5' exonuclease [Nitrospirae bacterium]|nr:3'-5' exonuclease [Nitrospirota bacterium]